MSKQVLRFNNCFLLLIILAHTKNKSSPSFGTTISKKYKRLFRAGIDPAARNAAVDCSATAPNVS